MRVSDVRKKYPEFFVTVEAAVWDDMRIQQKAVGIKLPAKLAKNVAYNAAAVATLELHKIVMALKKTKKAK